MFERCALCGATGKLYLVPKCYGVVRYEVHCGACQREALLGVPRMVHHDPDVRHEAREHMLDAIRHDSTGRRW